ncbi:MAG: hypothetical protein AAGC60_09605 [Acidobacteriota bacterium]
MSNKEPKNALYKLALAGLTAIFLGAVGSGIWDLLLADIVTWLFGALGTAVGKVFGTYFDFLYARVGRGLWGELSLLPFLLLTFGILAANVGGFIYFIFLTRFRRKMRTGMAKSPVTTMSILAFFSHGFGFWIIISVVIFNTLIYSHDILRTVYRIKAVVWVERSIEILRPHVDHSKFLELRAAYRSIDSAESFYRLHRDLEYVSSEVDVKLPEFEPIGGSP